MYGMTLKESNQNLSKTPDSSCILTEGFTLQVTSHRSREAQLFFTETQGA